jgi:hypothetical protein
MALTTLPCATALACDINVKKLFSLNIFFCMGRITHRKPQKSFLLSCRTCQRFSGIVICISASPYNQRGFYVVAYYVKLVGTRSPPRVQLAVWFKFIVLPVRCYLYGFNSHRLLKLLQIIRELIDACEISDDVSSLHDNV